VFIDSMGEQIKKAENIRIITCRPEGQKREYSTYIEVSSNNREVSLKFCDLKPQTTTEEIEKIKETGQVRIPVNSEIVVPFDVADSLLKVLQEQIATIKKQNKTQSA